MILVSSWKGRGLLKKQPHQICIVECIVVIMELRSRCLLLNYFAIRRCRCIKVHHPPSTHSSTYHNPQMSNTFQLIEINLSLFLTFVLIMERIEEYKALDKMITVGDLWRTQLLKMSVYKCPFWALILLRSRQRKP